MSRRRMTLAMAALAVLVGGCMPTPMTTQGQDIHDLYVVFMVGGDRKSVV